ncbi:MAG: glycosyltransferase [Chitinophagales bacterium]|nr:glycosyltransferase [Chitinophagales bacterium]
MEHLLFTLLIVTLIRIFYFIFFYRRVADFNIKYNHESTLLPVSIVICSRNGAHNLRRNLIDILNQEYFLFEVIVVNDNSDDDTEIFLMNLSAEYDKLVVRNIRQSSTIMKGKKYPLTIGIRATKFETILVTDADCSVVGNNWILSMAKAFNTGNEIVLGYAPYKRRKGLLNKFIRFEAFFNAIQYFSYALSGIPYMGVGRNMAYRKKLFFDHNIYPKHPGLLSGDDDLLVNAAANRNNTAVQLNPESFMYSEAKSTWSEYWNQKKRHISTAKYYKKKHQILLLFFSFSHVMFYSLTLLLLIYSDFYLELAAIFFTRLCVEGVIYFYCMRRLHEDDLFRWFPVLDVLFLFYYFKLLPGIFNNKQVLWQ